jgi:hypothetical protein
MKFKLFIVLLFNITHLAISQVENEYEFIGALRIPNQDIITYKIIFTEVEKGVIEGESFTDFFGKDFTKSKITGTINKRKNKISFTEVGNISSTSIKDTATFCYISAEDLKIKSIAKNRVLQGEFQGYLGNGDSCATGTMHLAGSEVLAKFNLNNDSLRKIDSIVKAQRLVDKPVEVEAVTPVEEILQLKNDDKVSLKWKSEKIMIDVWDGSKEDNDMISVYFNDSLIAKNLIIMNDKKSIEIPNNTGVLKIVAVNTGDKGQNTVNILLKDNGKPKHMMSVLNTGEEVLIKFNL